MVRRQEFKNVVIDTWTYLYISSHSWLKNLLITKGQQNESTGIKKRQLSSASTAITRVLNLCHYNNRYLVKIKLIIVP